MKNNEAYNNELKERRIKRALKLKAQYDSGVPVVMLAKKHKITRARIYKLLASVK